jgi:hypothetical protein
MCCARKRRLFGGVVKEAGMVGLGALHGRQNPHTKEGGQTVPKWADS